MEKKGLEGVKGIEGLKGIKGKDGIVKFVSKSSDK